MQRCELPTKSNTISISSFKIDDFQKLNPKFNTETTKVPQDHKAKPFKYSGSRLALSLNFLNHRSKISIGTTNLLPSTPQNDCIKLKRFSPTFIASRSILFSAATSSEGSAARSSTETPILAERGASPEAVRRISPPLPGSGQGRLRTAEGRLRVTAPQKRNGDPGDWM